MENWMPVIVASVSSGGVVVVFLSFILKSIKATKKREEYLMKLLLGLAHDRIVTLALNYIEAGEITKDEYDNLRKYLYLPYKGIGGNGSAVDWLMEQIEKLTPKIDLREKALRGGAK